MDKEVDKICGLITSPPPPHLLRSLAEKSPTWISPLICRDRICNPPRGWICNDRVPPVVGYPDGLYYFVALAFSFLRGCGPFSHPTNETVKKREKWEKIGGGRRFVSWWLHRHTLTVSALYLVFPLCTEVLLASPLLYGMGYVDFLFLFYDMVKP